MPVYRILSLPLRRIPHLLRPLRPPNSSTNPSQRLRHFTQNGHKLLLLSRPVPRPQLPYLHTPSNARAPKLPFQSQINRLISTERKAKWKQTFWWQVRFHMFFWPVITLIAIAGTSARQLLLEQEHPTPPDWTLWSRWIMRNRKEFEFGNEYRRGAINWQFLGEGYLHLLERLERGADAQGVKEVDDEGGLWVEGIGKTGYDVSAKSATWKQGYYEALMGTARVAENLDGWVKHKDGKGKAYPKEMIASPSNPEPQPIPPDWKGKPPAAEDCIPAFESPATMYTRVMTTVGFTNRMKVDASIAWAEWLEFKGLKETAEEVLKWGRDIAASGMNQRKLDEVVDINTGAFKPSISTRLSENMLRSSTALAVHYAQSGDVGRALPMFLSIMKARRDLSPSLIRPRVVEEDEEDEGGIIQWLWNLVGGSDFPPIPSSGDEPPNQTLKEACEQTGVMTYIGEILYATSSNEEGLSWTRDAVDGAEAILWAMDEQRSQEGKEKCEECLEIGLLNWQRMANKLAMKAGVQEIGKQANGEKSSWMSFGKKPEPTTQRWLREQEQVELRIERTKPLLKNRFGQVEILPPTGLSGIIRP